MKDNRITLIKLYILKERMYWLRMKNGFKRFVSPFGKVLGGGLLTLIITIFHYIFASAHLMFECVMYFVNKHQFRLNMSNLHSETIEKLTLLRNE